MMAIAWDFFCLIVGSLWKVILIGVLIKLFFVIRGKVLDSLR